LSFVHYFEAGGWVKNTQDW